MASPADAFDRRNLLTYSSLLCGVVAIAGAQNGRAPIAGFFMAAAVIADTFDGRFARRFGNEPRRRALGIELDSLSDAVAFGVAPPLCAVLLLRDNMGNVGPALWAAVFVHAACAITRLASFNVDAADSPQAGFIGIPVPLAALVWATALLVQPSAAATSALILVTAAAMVLPLRVPRPTGAGLMLFACWPVAVMILHAVAAL